MARGEGEREPHLADAMGSRRKSALRRRFDLTIAPTARRQLTEKLPDAVAFAAYEFIVGPLLDNPLRAGKRLRPPLNDRYSARRGTYRVIHRIDAQHRRFAAFAP